MKVLSNNSGNYRYCTLRTYVSPQHKYAKEIHYITSLPITLRNAILNIARPLCINGIYIHNDLKLTSLADLRKIVKILPEFVALQNVLSSQAIDAVISDITEDIKSFKELSRKHSYDPRWNVRPNFPKNKHSNGHITVTYNYVVINNKRHSRVLTLSKTGISIVVPDDIDMRLITSISLIPLSHGYYIDLVYREEQRALPEKEKLTSEDRILGIDIGIKNKFALTSNCPDIPLIAVNGSDVMSINQYYFSKRDRLHRDLPKGVQTSKRLAKLEIDRNHRIDDNYHKTSKNLVSFAVVHGIKCIVIGNNRRWKTKSKLRGRVVRNFQSTPFMKLINMIKHKAESAGILVIIREESYTSKCSFLDLEPIEARVEYVGNRTMRGLFVSNNGTRINADMNGSYNIIRKEFGNQIFGNINRYYNLPVYRKSYRYLND